MTTRLRLSSTLVPGLLAGHALAAAPATVPQAECQVWQREFSFARSVADHDAVAFAQHLHPEAAFGVSRTPTRGRDAITREWMPLIQGTTLKLSWYPAVVTLGGDGRTAYSSGPALYEDPKTGESRIGRFDSVWHRGDDGVWRVLFDDGVSPQKADAAAIQRFHEGRREQCPAA